MYYPYLRGRREELAAIVATAPQMANSGKIIPIIEPVNVKTRALEHAATAVLKAKVPLVMITNPQVGALAGGANLLRSKEMLDLLAHPELIPGFIVTTETTASQANAFLKSHPRRRVCFLHLTTPAAEITANVNSHGETTTHVFAQVVASSYVKTLNGMLVALSDNFRRAARNANYPPDEFFSDDHLTFATKKLTGFSDYSIVGNYFTETGGPAHAVAIHLHHEKLEPEGLWIRHFLSDRVVGSVDVAGKFAEAVAKLDNFAARNPKVYATDACQEFRQCHRNGHYPGLGVVKQLSMRHHIETLAAIL